ncbi:MAG: hypothetical protein RBT33_00045 [Candidatus Dojkabacteria bacterium]|jgi:hypothetical protein|nr:hypothetical protein [Candidatus Dojkabacteria bacterium]
MWKKFNIITRNIPTVINTPTFTIYSLRSSVFSFLSINVNTPYIIKHVIDENIVKRRREKTNILSQSYSPRVLRGKKLSIENKYNRIVTENIPRKSNVIKNLIFLSL